MKKDAIVHFSHHRNLSVLKSHEEAAPDCLWSFPPVNDIFYDSYKWLCTVTIEFSVVLVQLDELNKQ